MVGCIKMKINWMLLASVTPYLSVLAYDVWLHVNHRKVPPKERRAHSISIILFGVFFITSVGLHSIAVIALACVIPVMLYDEIVFHKLLSKHERTVHNLAGICLLGFITTWIVSIFYN